LPLLALQHKKKYPVPKCPRLCPVILILVEELEFQKALGATKSISFVECQMLETRYQTNFGDCVCPTA
jgi:hypothetical protein